MQKDILKLHVYTFTQYPDNARRGIKICRLALHAFNCPLTMTDHIAIKTESDREWSCREAITFQGPMQGQKVRNENSRLAFKTTLGLLAAIGIGNPKIVKLIAFSKY